jgi:molecular chaperone GrpE
MSDEKTEPIEQEQPERADVESPQEPDKLRQELDDVRAELDKVQKEHDELFGRLQRVSADYANFQKRVPRQISDSVDYEREKIVRSFLPVLDNFDHTLKAHSGESTDAMVRGVEIIYGQMLDILRSHGVQQIQALGEPFDPSQHEAMMRREEPGKSADIVLEELQKGYMMNGRVLRPSRVIISTAKAELPPPQESKDKAGEEGTDAAETASGQEQ